MKRKRTNTRARASHMAELQIQRELAQQQLEVLARLDEAMAALPTEERDGIKISLNRKEQA